jgi:hypothetical protein
MPPRKKNLAAIEECKKYIRVTHTLPEAQERGKEDGFSANTSVWLSAFAELLKVVPS